MRPEKLARGIVWAVTCLPYAIVLALVAAYMTWVYVSKPDCRDGFVPHWGNGIHGWLCVTGYKP
jgi:hypothetical protein